MHILKVSLFLLFVLPSDGYAKAIDFVVTNNTALTLFKLQISSDQQIWSGFGSVNLQPGNSASFEWHSTPESNCIQFLRGKFISAGWSAIVKVNFCDHPNMTVTFK